MTKLQVTTEQQESTISYKLQYNEVKTKVEKYVTHIHNAHSQFDLTEATQ